jgi:hypothetical protein
MIRICNDQDLLEMYRILYSHNKIAGLDTPNTSFEDFKKKFNKDIITFGYFEDNKLVSFLITKKILEIPSWYVSMMSSEKSFYFDFEKSGLADLFDASAEYWETQGIFSFILIQSIRHRNLLNGRIAQYCKKLSEYQIPGATLEVIKKGTISSSSLISKLCNNNIFQEDKIVKWVFRQDYLQENFK